MKKKLPEKALPKVNHYNFLFGANDKTKKIKNRAQVFEFGTFLGSDKLQNITSAFIF